MTPRAALIQSDGAAIAVTPVMHKRIGGAQLGARREKEEGSPGAVRDAELAQRLHHLDGDRNPFQPSKR